MDRTRFHRTHSIDSPAFQHIVLSETGNHQRAQSAEPPNYEPSPGIHPRTTGHQSGFRQIKQSLPRRIVKMLKNHHKCTDLHNKYIQHTKISSSHYLVPEMPQYLYKSIGLSLNQCLWDRETLQLAQAHAPTQKPLHEHEHTLHSRQSYGYSSHSQPLQYGSVQALPPAYGHIVHFCSFPYI